MLEHWTDRTGARQTASLGTKNLTDAKGICLDLEAFATIRRFGNCRRTTRHRGFKPKGAADFRRFADAAKG